LDTLPGTALKSFPYTANKEQLLYTFSAAAGEAPHTITEQWFAFFGGKQRYEPNADMRIRIYIDGESPASLDFQLYFAHMVGVQSCVDGIAGTNCVDPRVPWASADVQHMAHGGALKNTYRIPFSNTIRITASYPHSGVLYYYVRGMTNLPVVVGDLQLPNNARLTLHKNWDVVVPPLGKLPLVPKRSGGGLLYATMWSASSEYIGFMEGCVRAHADDGPTIYMSSGTEDYFESANFFNSGHPLSDETFNASDETASPESGVSYVWGNNSVEYGFNYSMAAYKFHKSDPIVWWDSFELTASNYDGGGQDPGAGGLEGCQIPAHPPPKVKPVRFHTYAWTYEWPAAPTPPTPPTPTPPTPLAPTPAAPTPAGPLVLSEYFLGQLNESCHTACAVLEPPRNCSEQMELGEAADNGTRVMDYLGIGDCWRNATDGGHEVGLKWFDVNQPGYDNLSSDVNYRMCVGFVGYPKQGVNCGAKHPAVQRVCHCTPAQ
jgi:hypothetical protein